MIDQCVPAVVPPASHSGSDRVRSAPRDVRGLPLPDLGRLPETPPMRYAIAAVDCRGQIADRPIMNALRWSAGDRVDAAMVAGAVVFRASSSGLFTVTGRGHIRVPAPVRRFLSLSAGTRVLLVASPPDGVLVVHTLTTLDAMVAQHHAGLGGDDQ